MGTLVFARELLKDYYTLEVRNKLGPWFSDKVLGWLETNVGALGDTWTYYFLIDYFHYAAIPNENGCYISVVDIVWEFNSKEDAAMFVVAWER